MNALAAVAFGVLAYRISGPVVDWGLAKAYAAYHERKGDTVKAEFYRNRTRRGTP